MTQREALELAQRIAADVRPAVVLCDVYDDVPENDPEHCPCLSVLWQAQGQWYASIVRSEREYVTFLHTVREVNGAAAVSLN